jgi:hypothetical protein
MEDATEHVRALARRVVDAALELGPLRGALLAGSGARGDADLYSDVDLLLYVDDAPPDDRLDRLREAVRGTDPIPIAPPELVQFSLGGVAVQVGYSTVAEIEAQLEAALDRLEEVIDSPNQKLLSGFLEGVPLHGEDLIAVWRARAAAYPDALRVAAIEHHWLRGHVAKLSLAPPKLADRLESLFRLPPREAADELARLVVEARDLVAAELPELGLPLRRPPGERARPWTV